MLVSSTLLLLLLSVMVFVVYFTLSHSLRGVIIVFYLEWKQKAITITRTHSYNSRQQHNLVLGHREFVIYSARQMAIYLRHSRMVSYHILMNWLNDSRAHDLKWKIRTKVWAEEFAFLAQNHMFIEFINYSFTLMCSAVLYPPLAIRFLYYYSLSEREITRG